MNNKLRFIFYVPVLFIVLQACNHKTKSNIQHDTVVSGTINVAVDESFQPIVDEEAYVFGQLYANAKPHFIYKPENDVLRLLLNDSARVAILSRDLTKNEVRILTNRTLPPEVNRFAVDAVALIVNKASNDTLMTVNEIKQMLNGESKPGTNIVFDNPNSSLVRYLKAFSGNKDFKQKNIYALKTNKEVIKYVSEHPQSIGITGFSWLNDPDSDYADAVKNIKIVSVKDENSKTDAVHYFAPSQTTLDLKQYPLTRELYIINCTGKMGLGTGFASFILSERGQRIILKSGLLPEFIPGREIHIQHTY
jgi:phosphate transport system substrate-binding protein